jgi:hypothetical protein
MSSNIISCKSIFPLIYSFVFLFSLEILADRHNASSSVIAVIYQKQNRFENRKYRISKVNVLKMVK